MGPSVCTAEGVGEVRWGEGATATTSGLTRRLCTKGPADVLVRRLCDACAEEAAVLLDADVVEVDECKQLEKSARERATGRRGRREDQEGVGADGGRWVRRAPLDAVRVIAHNRLVKLFVYHARELPLRRLENEQGAHIHG